MRGLGAVAQAQIERQGIAGEGEARTEAEIGLIDVAGADVVVDTVEAACVSGFVPCVAERAGIGAADGGQIGARDHLRRGIDAEPQKRKAATGGPAQRRQMRLQRIAQLIGEPARGMAALGQGGLDARQGGGNFVRPVGFNDRLRRPKSQQALGPGRGVIQDDGRISGSHCL